MLYGSRMWCNLDFEITTPEIAHPELHSLALHDVKLSLSP